MKSVIKNISYLRSDAALRATLFSQITNNTWFEAEIDLDQIWEQVTRQICIELEDQIILIIADNKSEDRW